MAVWLRRSSEGKTEKFGPEDNTVLTVAFEEMIFNNGPWFLELKQSGLQVDFLGQEVRRPGVSRSERLELEWDATAPTSYMPSSTALTAEDEALLKKSPGSAQSQWLWWSGSPGLFETESKTKALWRRNENEQDCAALEAGYAEFLLDRTKKVFSVNDKTAVDFEEMRVFRVGESGRSAKGIPIARAVFRWFWAKGSAGDSSGWVPHGPAASVCLETALLASRHTAALPDGEFIVSLGEMMLYRRSTKFQRIPVRRVGTTVTESCTSAVRIIAAFHALDKTAPEGWAPMAAGQPHLTVTLEQDSLEFEEIAKLFHRTFNPAGLGNRWGTIAGTDLDPKFLDVVQITRLQSIPRWRDYVRVKQAIVHRWNSQVPALKCSRYLNYRPFGIPLCDPQSNEYLLWHGCDAQGLVDLMFFDHRFTGLFGAASHEMVFHENSSKANQLVSCPICLAGSVETKKKCSCTSPNTTRPYAMLLCRAVLGNSFLSTETTDTRTKGPEDFLGNPPKIDTGALKGQPFDSVLIEGEAAEDVLAGKEARYREVILFKVNQFYPEYAVFYWRKDMEKVERRERSASMSPVLGLDRTRSFSSFCQPPSSLHTLDELKSR